MQDSQNAAQKTKNKLGDEYWRLNHLYFITDSAGKKIQFKMNWAQKMFYHNMWFLNIILKARQLGFTTFIQIFLLDRCLFTSNVRAGVIAHSQDDAKVFFRDKIKFAYDNLPQWIKDERPALKNDAGELLLSNNSSIRVGTSLRSGTFQYLHISEFGKICRKYPEKAKEVITGALNTVHAGQFVFIESTAEGREGRFYTMTKKARNMLKAGKKLTKMDYKFHFFPWWKEERYQIDSDNTALTEEYAEYFQELKEKHGIELTDRQKAWYVVKCDEQEESMKQEHPSTPDEAFEQSIKGAIYGKQMTWLRNNRRITKVPHEPKFPVYTFWDIGRNDMNAIWFMQRVGKLNQFIRYYENHQESMQFYGRHLQELATKHGYYYETCYLPHDAAVVDYTRDDNKSRAEVLEDMGFKVETVERPKDKGDARQAARDALPTCVFDESFCDQGIKCLENYQFEWDEKLGCFKDRARHDWTSHGNDAFEQFARGFDEPILLRQTTRKRNRNWKRI